MNRNQYLTEVQRALEILSKAKVPLKEWQPKDPTLHEGKAVKNLTDKGFSLREAAHITGAEPFSHSHGTSFPEMSEGMLLLAKEHAKQKAWEYHSSQDVSASFNPHKAFLKEGEGVKAQAKVNLQDHHTQYKSENKPSDDPDFDDLEMMHHFYTTNKNSLSNDLVNGVTKLKSLTKEVANKRKDTLKEIRLGYLGDTSETSHDEAKEDLDNFIEQHSTKGSPGIRKPGGHEAPVMPGQKQPQKIMTQQESIEHGSKSYSDHLVNTIADAYLKHITGDESKGGQLPEGLSPSDLVKPAYIGGLRGIMHHDSSDKSKTLHQSISYGIANAVRAKIGEYLGQHVVPIDSAIAKRKKTGETQVAAIKTSDKDARAISDVVGTSGNEEEGGGSVQMGNQVTTPGRKFALENPEMARRAIEKAKAKQK